MKRDALAFFRILPAGAADIGEDVTREDLRAAGAGQWVVTERMEDDVSCIFGPERAKEIPLDYDIPLPLNEAQPLDNERVIQLKFRDVG